MALAKSRSPSGMKGAAKREGKGKEHNESRKGRASTLMREKRESNKNSSATKTNPQRKRKDNETWGEKKGLRKKVPPKIGGMQKMPKGNRQGEPVAGSSLRGP